MTRIKRNRKDENIRTYTPEEATKFFRSYGAKCDENDVKQWVKETPNLDRREGVNETDLYAFNDWLRCKGTLYELGIDDQTRIDRMLEEIAELKKENNALKEEIRNLTIKHEPLLF